MDEELPNRKRNTVRFHGLIKCEMRRFDRESKSIIMPAKCKNKRIL